MYSVRVLTIRLAAIMWLGADRVLSCNRASGIAWPGYSGWCLSRCVIGSYCWCVLICCHASLLQGGIPTTCVADFVAVNGQTERPLCTVCKCKLRVCCDNYTHIVWMVRCSWSVPLGNTACCKGEVNEQFTDVYLCVQCWLVYMYIHLHESSIGGNTHCYVLVGIWPPAGSMVLGSFLAFLSVHCMWIHANLTYLSGLGVPWWDREQHQHTVLPWSAKNTGLRPVEMRFYWSGISMAALWCRAPVHC